MKNKALEWTIGCALVLVCSADLYGFAIFVGEVIGIR